MTTGEIIALASCIVALLALLLNGRRDSRGSAADQARVETTLNGIATGVDDIRVEQRAMRTRVDDLSVRVGKVEESAKSAHHRLDTHEKRIEHIEHMESEEKKHEDQLACTNQK